MVLVKYIRKSDLQVLRLVNSHLHCLTLDIIMNIITQLVSVLAVFLPLCFILNKKSDLAPIGLQLAIVLSFSQLLVLIFKHLVNRPRPFKVFDDIIVKYRPTCRYSFPSGHTCAAFCLAFVLASVFPHLSPLFFTMAFLVGLSRIYLGAHYPTDVICGWAVAYFTFALNTHFFA